MTAARCITLSGKETERRVSGRGSFLSLLLVAPRCSTPFREAAAGFEVLSGASLIFDPNAGGSGTCCKGCRARHGSASPSWHLAFTIYLIAGMFE
jgi:hypothetical protein